MELITETGGEATQQDPNAAVGTMNMIEIQFGSIGVVQPHPSTIERSANVFGIQFGTIGTIAGGFAGSGTSNSAQERYYRSINSMSYLPLRSQPPITFSDANFSINILTKTTRLW